MMKYLWQCSNLVSAGQGSNCQYSDWNNTGKLHSEVEGLILAKYLQKYITFKLCFPGCTITVNVYVDLGRSVRKIGKLFCRAGAGSELDVADQIIDNEHRQRNYVGKKLGSRLLCTPIDTQSHDGSIITKLSQFCKVYLRNNFSRLFLSVFMFVSDLYVQVKGNLMTKGQIHR